MPTAHSIWDRLPGLDTKASEGLRRLARIEPFETLSGPPEPEGLAGADRFAADLRIRLKQWPGLLHEPREAPEPYSDSMWLDTPFKTAYAGLLLIASAFAFSGLTLGMVAMGLSFAAVVFVRRSSLHSRLASALSHRHCPDCGYSLRGVPSGLDPDLFDGPDPGPKRCPECGVAWPLLPPPPLSPYQSKS